MENVFVNSNGNNAQASATTAARKRPGNWPLILVAAPLWIYYQSL